MTMDLAKRLLAFDTPLFAQDALTRTAFVSEIKQLCTALQHNDAQRFVLFSDDLTHFASNFLALLCAGKHIILPPSDKPAMLERLAPHTDMTIGQCHIEGIAHFSRVPSTTNASNTALTIDSQSTLCFFTSGSSGEPKQITKRWAQLLSEVNDLESLWGQQLGSATVYSTVSHQHIYGLLFKLLWPILNGRTINAQTIAYPETLVQHLAPLAPNTMVLVSSPAFLQRTADEPLWQQHAEQFAQVFSSGGPLATASALSIAKALSRGPVEVLGSTETGGIAWRTQPGLWQPFTSVNVKAGDDNRLVLKSPYVYKGDWYQTEDAIALTPEGQFELLGRLDRIVKIEQKRLSLDELEAALSRHEFVKHCRAVVLSGKRQTIGCVCTLSEQGENALNHQDKRHVNLTLRNHLAHYFDTVLLPRKWRYLDALPVNAQGKIPVNTLVELFQS